MIEPRLRVSEFGQLSSSAKRIGTIESVFGAFQPVTEFLAPSHDAGIAPTIRTRHGTALSIRGTTRVLSQRVWSAFGSARYSGFKTDDSMPFNGSYCSRDSRLLALSVLKLVCAPSDVKEQDRSILSSRINVCCVAWKCNCTLSEKGAGF